MIDRTLLEKRLEAPLIIQGYVNDEPKCNYERYLTELLNHSEFFMQKSKNAVFHWQVYQAHGEPDAVSENYSIDYKLFATKSTLQGLRETSSSIKKMGEGAYAFGNGRWSTEKPFISIRTVAALRQYSIKDFNRIALSPVDKIEYEVSIILKSLRVQKNLLLFYPYTMLFSEPHTFEEGCNSISEAFNEDFSKIGIYRKNEAPAFDTYLCVIYDEKLLIFELNEDCWQLKDFVEMRLSKTYTDLYFAFGNDGFNI
ncbi:MAG: hypothetical protein IJK02_02640 [Clostridia bacterium]|nr:hypothetical protein [Clostridia bacterium]